MFYRNGSSTWWQPAPRSWDGTGAAPVGTDNGYPTREGPHVHVQMVTYRLAGISEQ